MTYKEFFQFMKTLELLSTPEGIGRDELARALDVDRRSVDRLFKFFDDFRFPVTEAPASRGKKKRWHLPPDSRKKGPNLTVPDVRFTTDEVIALHMLRNRVDLLRDTGLEEYVTPAILKLATFVPPEDRQRLDRIRDLFLSGTKFPKKYRDKKEVIDRLTDTIIEKERCRAGYRRFYDQKERVYKIEPLYLFEHRGGLYVFVRNMETDEIRSLELRRIHWVLPMGESFEYPTDFDPEKILSGAFEITFEEPVHVKVWFSDRVARYIKERTWHPSQKIRKHRGGGIVLSMTASGRGDIKNWVLSHGANARLLEPEDLREEVARDIGEARQLYG